MHGYGASDAVSIGMLQHAIREAALRPPDWSGAYELHPVPLPDLRKALFGSLTDSVPEVGALAEACLKTMDELRDEHGPSEFEPRHPNIEAGIGHGHWLPVCKKCVLCQSILSKRKRRWHRDSHHAPYKRILEVLDLSLLRSPIVTPLPRADETLGARRIPRTTGPPALVFLDGASVDFTHPPPVSGVEPQIGAVP